MLYVEFKDKSFYIVFRGFASDRLYIHVATVSYFIFLPCRCIYTKHNNADLTIRCAERLQFGQYIELFPCNLLQGISYNCCNLHVIDVRPYFNVCISMCALGLNSIQYRYNIILSVWFFVYLFFLYIL